MIPQFYVLASTPRAQKLYFEMTFVLYVHCSMIHKSHNLKTTQEYQINDWILTVHSTPEIHLEQ